MSRSARSLAAALLVAALPVPASLHASTPPGLAAHEGGGMSLRSEGLSLDWLLRYLQQVLPKVGGGSGNPDGGASVSPRNPRSSTECGGPIDPSGGCYGARTGLQGSPRRPGARN
jgi:hypothetical protein